MAAAGAALSIVVAGTPAPAGAELPSVAPIRLQVAHGQFVDSTGRVVILHGVNLTDKCGTSGPVVSSGCPHHVDPADAYPDSDSLPNGSTTRVAKFLAEHGFNFVRLGLNFSNLVPTRPATPGKLVVNEAYLGRVMRVARLLAAHHIWFMLDMHQDCFEEWPSWAVPWDAADQTRVVPPFPECMLTANSVTRAFDNLWKWPTDPDNPTLPGGSAAAIPVHEVWTDYREM